MNSRFDPDSAGSPAQPLHGKRRKLWHFHGGIHVPDEKSLSNGRPLRPAPLPAQLVIPLQQHIGAPARPKVRVGDQVLRGQVVAEAQGYISSPVHASSSGTVTAIEPRAVPHPSGMHSPCVVIATDGDDRWAELPAPIELEAADAATLRERIRQSGIVGMGGASFPTNVKLNPGKDQPISTLILNGAECEPYITCDDLLMRERAADIVDGARIMLHMLGAPECLIGVEDNKPEAIEALRLEATLADDARLHVVEIPTLYPSGGEKQLIRILTGKEVPTHGIPAQVGIVCQNVGTAAAVADAVLRGIPLIERWVTVTGRAIAEPQNLSVRIGTPAADLVAAAGGYSGEVVKLLAGGPMMGLRLQTDAVPVTKSFNCVLALTEAESPDPGPALACIRCGTCADHCPVSLLPQQMYWHARAKDLDKVQDYNLFDCIECGCCAHVCPSHIPLVQYYRYAKTEVWAREKEKRASEHARERHAAREARLERLERERKAKLRKKKEAITPKAKPPAGKPATDPATDADEARKAKIRAARERAAAKKAAEGASAAAAADATPTDADDARKAKIRAARERAAAKKAAAEAAAPASEQPAAAPAKAKTSDPEADAARKAKIRAARERAAAKKAAMEAGGE
jgi:electron transport complex protein RnfC